MHEPTTTALLAGVVAALQDDVLPELAPGAAQRQLKSALVTLRRLERAQDRMAVYLNEEAADITATLACVLAPFDDPRAAALAARAREDTVPEILADPVAARERDLRLQALVVDVGVDLRGRDDRTAARELRALHRRMLQRQDTAWGTAAAPA